MHTWIRYTDVCVYMYTYDTCIHACMHACMHNNIQTYTHIDTHGHASRNTNREHAHAQKHALQTYLSYTHIQTYSSYTHMDMLRATPTVSTCTLEHYTHTHRHMDMLRATPTVSTRTLKNVLAGRLISPASDSREQLLHQYITAIHRLTNLELVASVSEDKCASSSVASLASGSLMKRSACVCVCVCVRARAYTHTDTHTHTHTLGRP
jgi:hypothetical protein